MANVWRLNANNKEPTPIPGQVRRMTKPYETVLYKVLATSKPVKGKGSVSADAIEKNRRSAIVKEVRVKVAVEAAGNRQRDINVGDEIRQSAQGEGALNAVEIAIRNDGIDVFDAAGGNDCVRRQGNNAEKD